MTIAVTDEPFSVRWSEHSEPQHLYVVAWSSDGEIPSPDDPVWTLSPVPDRLGWQTDCGQFFYGIPRRLAEQIADAWYVAGSR